MNKSALKNKYQFEVNKYIKGGYEGLKKLFESIVDVQNLSCSPVFDEINFDDFINGKQIRLLGWTDKKNAICKINFNDNYNYRFSNFYEQNFNFKFTNFALDFITEGFILQGTINLIEQFKNEEGINENDFIEFLKNVLMLLDAEIIKSENGKEIDNPKLLDKLIYIQNGYIETYNKVFNLYSHYIPNYIKENVNTQQKKPKVSDWHLVFIEIIKGNVLIKKESIYLINYSYCGKEVKSPSDLGKEIALQLNKKENSIRPIITDSLNGGASKNIFKKTNHKKMKELIEIHGDNMCDYFKEKYMKLI